MIDNKRAKLFMRRTFILAGIKGAFLLSLIGKLYYLQIIKLKRYKTLSDSNRIKLFLVPPLRGRIVDRDNQLLAGNKNYYRILFDPQYKPQAKQTVEKLGALFQFSPEKIEALNQKIKQHTTRGPLLLHQHLTWKEVARVEVNSPDLPGISIDVGQIRYYPLSEKASHLLGYLGPVTEEEIKKNPLLNHPDFKTGKSSIERVKESTLRGKAGVKRMEVNAFGLTVRELSREDSEPGNDLKLTVQKDLQDFVGQQFAGKSGSAIVLDVKTGAVLALVSTPGFNPEKVTYGGETNYWGKLTMDQEVPLLNRAIAAQYPPGSTFKTISALASLAEGVDPNTQIYCPGHMDLGRTRFHCWKEKGHGFVNMTRAIEQSCNVYFYNMAKRIGIDPIESMAKKFGFGSKTDLMLPGEKSGLVPGKAWKKERYNAPWQSGDTVTVGIGQGYMLVTPMQLALATARIASGKIIKPRLTFSDIPEEFDDIDVPKAHLDLVRRGMNNVVNSGSGTAFRSRIRNKDHAMAGKTGTVQIISKKNYEKIGDKSQFKKEHHALFIGYAPTNDPRFSVSVIVEHGGSGSAAAAPIAKAILEKTQQLIS